MQAKGQQPAAHGRKQPAGFVPGGVMMSAATSSSLARAVNSLRVLPSSQAAVRAAGSAAWMKGRQSAGWHVATLAPVTRGQVEQPTQRRLMFSSALGGRAGVPSADLNTSLLATMLPGAGARTAGRGAWLLQLAPVGEQEGIGAKEGVPLMLQMDKWDDESKMVVLTDVGLGAEETGQLVYEAMNRNNRKPKAPNHGKRPCSRWRRRRKTYGINADGSKK